MLDVKANQSTHVKDSFRNAILFYQQIPWQNESVEKVEQVENLFCSVAKKVTKMKENLILLYHLKN